MPIAMIGMSFDGGTADCHIETVESVYNDISVLDSRLIIDRIPRFKDDMWGRYMKFNWQIQGGIAINSDGSLSHAIPESAAEYPHKLHIGMLFTGKAPKRALVIGCGVGSAPLAFAHDYEGGILLTDDFCPIDTMNDR